MELDSALTQVDRARLLWSSQDLDLVFSEIQTQLNLLQNKLKNNSASDNDLLQSLKLLEALDWPCVTPPPVMKVVIGSDVSTPTADSLALPALAPGTAVPVCERPPVAPVQYQPHCCQKSCVPTVPSMPLSQNPLNAPIICGFRRLNCETDQSESSEERTDQMERAVVYISPCGLRLCNYDDVMDFLLKTETYNSLQLDLFSFSTSVRVCPNPGTPETPSSGPSPGLDLSRGLELTPVELCVSEGERPLEFKYRRERWPRGCFLSNTVYRAYCDCRGRCGAGCACVNMTRGPGYQHERLPQPNSTGIFECGPWCGCDPGLCQNRVVQRGLRVRLQVYKTNQDLNQVYREPCPNQDENPEETKQNPDPDRGPDCCPDRGPDRGWGVRCKDDLEQGTFICIYAGVVLQRSNGQPKAPPPKQRRAELPSDDDIELVTEWLPSTTPNQTHVIQRGTEMQSVKMEGGPSPERPAGSEQASVNGSKRPPPQDRAEDLYLLDASREGNASRFFNHSCEPTLFVQNVFTDSHDVKFPNIAFFTNRALAAGMELTWDYNSAHSQEVHEPGQEVQEGNQEVPCVCRCSTCRERFYITELKQHGTLTI